MFDINIDYYGLRVIKPKPTKRGIEWSLAAFASIWAQRCPLQAGALTENSLASDEYFTGKLPTLKIKHASTYKNMRAWVNEYPLKFCKHFE